MTKLPPHWSIISSLLAKVTEARIPQNPPIRKWVNWENGEGGRKGEWWRGNSCRENAKTEIELYTAGYDTAKLYIHHSIVLLWDFASWRDRHHTGSASWVQYSAQVLECSCAVWGVQRKGTAVKPDLLGVCYIWPNKTFWKWSRRKW